MRALFFRAIAEHPSIEQPLMMQVKAALEPFDRYLRQAIHTARQRQVRYKLPWKRVEDIREFFLEPLDTRLRIRRDAPAWVLPAWPLDREPDPSRKLIVTNREEMMRVLWFERRAEGLAIRTDEDLFPEDQILWCGVTSSLARASAAPPPSRIQDEKGDDYEVVHAEALEDGELIIHVRGRPAGGPLFAGGQKLDAEPLPPLEGIETLYDAEHRAFRPVGSLLRVEEPPKGNELRAPGKLRFALRPKGRAGREGRWIQLLPPVESEDDDFLDPRAAFCENEVEKVWTEPRHRPESEYKVKQTDREHFQLRLAELPPKEAPFLYLPLDVRSLELQRRALRQLREAPLPHQRGLLRLCEDPQRARWPSPAAQHVEESDWFFLTDRERSGTDEQRKFVARALGSPDVCDLMLLEGPPGSGKTTVICELIMQCIERGERVLVCASTNVAIDNVLERLLEKPGVDAVRIGKAERVDTKVLSCQIDERIAALMADLRSTFGSLGEEGLRQMAERVVIMSANLTVGTTMGIIHHPLFQERDRGSATKPWERPIATMPHWDLLIVDEASKTTIQEFMVPAMMARRHVVVGDVRQLPPFTDREDLLANLRTLVDERDQPLFTPEEQRAKLLLFRLGRHQLEMQEHVRWLLAEPQGVIDALVREIEASEAPPTAALVCTRRSGARRGHIVEVTVDEAQTGHPQALWLAAASFVLVPLEILEQVGDVLPANLLFIRDLVKDERLEEGARLLFRAKAFRERSGKLRQPFRERRDRVETFAELGPHESKWLARHDWAGEVIWRLTRRHELRHGKSQAERSKLKAGLERLLPLTVNVKARIEEIEEVGLPSILEVLQEGIGQDVKRSTALTRGLRARPDVFAPRFSSLSFQHRMHPDISAFSRAVIYEGKALLDANTIAHRDARIGWDFGGRLGARRAWLDVRGREEGGTNPDEVRAIEQILKEFMAWAARKGPPNRALPRVWEVACLCFYVKQEGALRAMLQRLTNSTSSHRFHPAAHVEIVCGTVDRFQGREADLVFLSMRNTGRVGFLDSPNRLNVAVTRARQQLVVVGNAGYFASCDVPELQGLVRQTHLLRRDR